MPNSLYNIIKPNFLQTAYQVSGRGIGRHAARQCASGWLMLAGICLCSWQMGLWALGGLAVSTLSPVPSAIPKKPYATAFPLQRATRWFVSRFVSATRFHGGMPDDSRLRTVDSNHPLVQPPA